MLRASMTALLFGVLASQLSWAQASDRQKTAPPAVQAQSKAEMSAAIKAARDLLAAGLVEEALEKINGVVEQDPASREAVLVKLTALGPERLADALSAYDRFTAATRAPDAGLLAFLARRDLGRTVRQQGDQGVINAALERLGRHGDVDARARLQRAVASVPSVDQTVAASVCLARLGDAASVRRLGDVLATAATPDAKVNAMEALKEVGARGEAAKVAALLGEPEPQVRAMAALVVGSLQFAPAAPQLEAMFREDVPAVRMYAAVALKRLGRSTADGYLAQLLQNALPEVRLIAAEAFQGSTATDWIPAVRSILTDRNEENRLRAAAALACCDQTAARSALRTALDSPYPSMRAEAARILEMNGLADAQMARRLLGDAFPAVRVHGAGAALLLADPKSR